MESKHYICEYSANCQYAKAKNCAFGTSVLKDILDNLCGGNFDPQFTIFCEHPKVRAGVFLIKIKHNNIEGNYHNIWKSF